VNEQEPVITERNKEIELNQPLLSGEGERRSGNDGYSSSQPPPPPAAEKVEKKSKISVLMCIGLAIVKV
jgi:hypothetical protein